MKPVWIVNSLGELGVRIGSKCYFLYKGDNIEYDDSTHEEDASGFSAGEPIMWRRVFKREFGECVHPLNLTRPDYIGTVHKRDSAEWSPISEKAVEP